MPSRKRSLQAVDDDDGVTNRPRSTELLDRIRNMWQFANVCQWIYIFGKAAKIDESIDVEKMEVECLKPHSTLLADVALSILKLVSSHRGLTHDIFDDQIRKQYLAKSPKNNPFGSDRDPRSFADFDVFTKVKVLQQLTQWTLVHPERLREKMEEQKDTEQAGWRIEPYGWDREDRTYYVLDDNRVYRLTETPPAPPRPKTKKAKTYRAGRRSSKRQRVTSPAESAAEDMAEGELGAGPADDGLGGNIWECVAVTLEEVRAFLESLGKTRDENERVLRRQLQLHLVPILEKQEEAQKRKQQQRERELLNLAKMANAKRSSRIAGKAERQRQEEQEREEEEHKREEEASRKREERERLKMEKERDFRMFSRQRRLQEREARRLQHEEELAQLSEDGKTGPTAQGRISERRLLAEIEKNKQALRDLEEEEEAWIFDCVCGLYGQVDDGTHSVACERCNVWQHSKCLGISEGEADRPDFHFVCNPCQRQDEAGKAAPRSVIKLKLHPSATGTTNGTQGGGVSKRLRAVPAALRVRRPQAASKRRKQAGAGRKSFLLEQPLSEISTESADALVFDVDTFVYRPTEVRKQEQQKQGKVKRPLNDFVLYRKTYSAVAKERVLSEQNKNNQQLVSQICGESWGMEGANVKARFKRLANVERSKHFQAFPDYKYAPKSFKKTKDDSPPREHVARDQPSHGLLPASSAQALHPPGHAAFMQPADAVAMVELAQYPPAGPYWYHPSLQHVVAFGGVGQAGYPGSNDGFEHRGAHFAKEDPPPSNYPHPPSLHGTSARPLELCIDPSLLPRAGEPVYPYLATPEDCIMAATAGASLTPDLSDDFLTAMPDLDVDGAHNAYLRGTHGDWEVEFLDEASHFNDWMAQEEHANFQP
ncbi:phd finger domain-containing protein [Purpureocillium lavendulum]|uniref:Phd finger domain-containing protein n=1 Tax=Purpureocillium lavendulum TaxID=1247861 RepID=A0AB34G3L8_9HYPO|nr:phd finger domain-containing protein [Purpureocillium lavendulum]